MITIEGIDPNMTANNLIPLEPTHPGEVLEEELECRGISSEQLAEEIGISQETLMSLLQGKMDFNAEYALMLEAALGIDADFWINMQSNYNKNKAKKDKSFMSRLAGIRRIAVVL